MTNENNNNTELKNTSTETEQNKDPNEAIKKLVEVGLELTKEAAQEGSEELKNNMSGKPWHIKLVMGIGAVVLAGLVYIITTYQEAITLWITNLF